MINGDEEMVMITGDEGRPGVAVRTRTTGVPSPLSHHHHLITPIHHFL